MTDKHCAFTWKHDRSCFQSNGQMAIKWFESKSQIRREIIDILSLKFFKHTLNKKNLNIH